jgi:myosin heavy subunit
VNNEDYDTIRFQSLCYALEGIGCNRYEMSQMFLLLGVILHLGNIDFESTDSTDKTAPIIARLSTIELSKLAEILGVPANEFIDALTSHEIASSGKFGKF